MTDLILSSQAAATLAAPPTADLQVPATPASCTWGYIDPATAPAHTVPSGARLAIETVTHHSGDAPELMMDDGVRAIWDAIDESERGPGVHLLTGPIEVEGARRGGALAVRIDEMTPRFGHGSNLAANWGALYPRFGKERVTIYRLDGEIADGFPATAVPDFAYDFTGRPLYDVPGYITEPDAAAREPFGTDVVVPVRPHFGVMGVAPDGTERRSSIPPGAFGGNVDNWRLGPGATMYYPVFVDGAGLYAGDPHFAQGDGEVCGTAIEASANGVLRVAAIDDLAITTPLLETATHWYTHGFGDTLDEAMLEAVETLLQLLQDVVGMSADDAYSLMSVAADVSITQVVDTVVGCHAGIRRDLFR